LIECYNRSRLVLQHRCLSMAGSLSTQQDVL
jgi:hypothetical protein